MAEPNNNTQEPAALQRVMTLEEARAFLNAPAQAAAEKPRIFVPGGGITISQSAQDLFNVIAPTNLLFQRGGAVVEVVERVSGYELVVVKAVAAQSRFENFVSFVQRRYQQGQQSIQSVNISQAIAEQYLQSEACRELLPEIIGVVEFPLLIDRPEGLQVAQNGFNPQTGYFVANQDTIETIQVEEAVRRINFLLEEFQFLTPGDRSRAIASLLTPALKFGGFIDGIVPIDVSEANASQSGKTLRQKLVAAVYNQRMAVVAHQKGGTGSTDEKIADLLIKGRPFIQFDNVRGYLDSQLLEAFVTAEDITVRGPYQPNVLVDASKHILFISSNGLETTKDLSNRSSIIRIVKRENYNFKTYDGVDLLQHVRANYIYFLSAIFSVIRHWHAAGKPRTSETRHDLREWCQKLDWIVQNVFHGAPLMENHEEAKRRVGSRYLGFLRSLAIAVERRGRLGVNFRASELATLSTEEGIEIPGLTSSGRASSQTPEQQIGRVMKELFTATNEIQEEQYLVRKVEQSVTTEGGNWNRSNVYVFARREIVTDSPRTP